MFLAACHSQPKMNGVEATSTTIPTPASTTTETPTLTPTLSHTPTSTPEPTLTNSPTPTFTYTLTPTRIPTITLKPTKTPHENPGYLVTFGETGKGGWPAIPVFSPDGKLIALASENVRIWNINTQELVYEFDRPYYPCYTEHASFDASSSLLAVSIYCVGESGPNATGHLLVWDTQSGVLLHDWEQKDARNTSETECISSRSPVPGFVFLPNDTRIAFSSGNTIEIRDARLEREPVVLELGDDMLGSDISVSENGEQLFVFMDFGCIIEFGDYLQKYALQIWKLKSRGIQAEIKYPDPKNTGNFIEHWDEAMSLSGKFLTYINYLKGIYKLTDLETWKMKLLPFHGDVEAYISPDTNYAVYFPTIYHLDRDNCNDPNVELWNTNTDQILYTFTTPGIYFETQWCYGTHTFAINQDNTLLAITHNDRVSLWDISNAVKISTTP